MDVLWIYALTEPGSKEVRYIGKSTNPKRRYYEHVQRAASYRGEHYTHTARWIRTLHTRGQKPGLTLLECIPKELWAERERWWIQEYKRVGARLTNHDDGGFGNPGDYSLTGEQRENLSHALKGKPKSLSHRKNLSRARTGTKWTSAQRTSIMAAREANPITMRRQVTGTKNPRCKLSEAQAIEIIKWIKGTGAPLQEFAVRYGVSMPTIEAIRSGRNWSHLAEYGRRKRTGA